MEGCIAYSMFFLPNAELQFNRNLKPRATFLQSQHDKHPQFITHHYRKQESNTYHCTNPGSNSYDSTMVKPRNYVPATA